MRCLCIPCDVKNEMDELLNRYTLKYFSSGTNFNEGYPYLKSKTEKKIELKLHMKIDEKRIF